MSVTELVILAADSPPVANTVAGPTACSMPPRAVTIHRNSVSAVLVQAFGIELVRLRRQVAERAVGLDPERYVADVEFLSHQRAADKLGIVVIDGRAGIAPVCKALDIDDPVVRPAGADEDARVGPRPIEGGIFAPGVRGTAVGERQKGRQGKDRVPPCGAAPGGGTGILFHGCRIFVSVGPTGTLRAARRCCFPAASRGECGLISNSPLLDHGEYDGRHQWFTGRLDCLDAHIRLRVIGRHHHFQNVARRHGDYTLRYDDVLGPAAGILTELHIGIGDIAPVHTLYARYSSDLQGGRAHTGLHHVVAVAQPAA